MRKPLWKLLESPSLFLVCVKRKSCLLDRADVQWHHSQGGLCMGLGREVEALVGGWGWEETF